MKKSFTLLAAVLVTLCTSSTALAKTPAPASDDGVKIAAPSTPKLYYSGFAEELRAPVTYAVPKNKVVTEGENVILECSFVGSDLTVEVFSNNDQIVFSKLDANKKNKYEYIFDSGDCIFVIKRAEPEDSGRYTFKARNAAGEAIVSCLVLVMTK